MRSAQEQVRLSVAVPDDAAVPREARSRRWTTLLATGVVLALGVIAAVGPSVLGIDPAAVNISERHLPPLSPNHPLGTDFLGRDILSRVLHGARTSVFVGLTVASTAAVFGTALGLVAGYLGRWVDALLMRVVDVQMALPTLLLVLFVLTVAGPGLFNLVTVMAISRWPAFARVARANTLKTKELEFVRAAMSVGAGPLWIMRVEILPNILPSAITLALLEIGYAILTEGGLSFLGLGIRAPDISWGLMLAGGQAYTLSAWWELACPGLAIVVACVSLNVLAMELRSGSDSVRPIGRG